MYYPVTCLNSLPNLIKISQNSDPQEVTTDIYVVDTVYNLYIYIYTVSLFVLDRVQLPAHVFSST